MVDICNAVQVPAADDKVQALNFPLSGSTVPGTGAVACGKGPGDIRKHVVPFVKPGGMLLSFCTLGATSHAA